MWKVVLFLQQHKRSPQYLDAERVCLSSSLATSCIMSTFYSTHSRRAEYCDVYGCLCVSAMTRPIFSKFLLRITIN